jgi:hypothetical protein
MSVSFKAPGFTTRTAARDYANKQGFRTFRTIWYADEGVWRARYEPGEGSLIDEWAKGKDFIAWTETGWRGPENKRERIGVAIVTITEAELREEPLDDRPEFCTFEPITPSLWEPERAATGGGKAVATATPRDSSPRGHKPPVEGRTGRNRVSTVAGPKALCWNLASTMTAQNPPATRKEVIAACIAAGVGKNTASTQYYMWREANKANIVKDGD